MHLNLTSEQALLRESAAKFIAAAGPKVARGLRAQDVSFAPSRLRQAGDLGWLGILVPGEANGLDLGLTELALVLGEAGRGLVCEPIGLAAISAGALAQGRAPHPMLERAMTGAAKEKPQQGKVTAVGAGKADKDGKRIALDVKEGDTILFGKYSGQEVRVDGEDYLIMREDEVLAVIEGGKKK